MTTEPNENLLEESAARTAKSIARFVRISPRKVRLVINAVRRRAVQEAFPILMTLNKKAARLTEKVLKSAVANAKVLGMDVERLYISEVRADGGPLIKRLMTRSMGRADRIIKRTTHLSIVLKEGNKRWPPAGKKAEDAETEGKASLPAGKEKGKKLKFKIPFGGEKTKAAAAAS